MDRELHPLTRVGARALGVEGAFRHLPEFRREPDGHLHSFVPSAGTLSPMTTLARAALPLVLVSMAVTGCGTAADQTAAAPSTSTSSMSASTTASSPPSTTTTTT